jgi:hypothetical protein
VVKEKWRVLKALWMRAEEMKGLEIDCESFQQAKRLRQELYAAGRRSRRPRTLDPELSAVIDKFSITILDGKVVKLYKQGVTAVVRQAEKHLLDVDSQESFKRLQELFQGTESTPPVIPKSATYRNPYLLEEK